jgi:hypothetical protein
MRVALGFRVKSGWAAAVLLGGSGDGPELLDRRVVELSDPAIPESRQPYHAGMGHLETNEAEINRRREIVVRSAHRSVAELIDACKATGHEVHRAGLVVGSETDPEKITNPHIRAHALEGLLFRTALADALTRCGLQHKVIQERHVYARAAEELHQSEARVKTLVTQIGRRHEGPWRADEKCAALAAWLQLVDNSAKG